MNKKKVDTSVILPSVPPASSSQGGELSSVGLGVVESGGQFLLVELKFDLVSGLAQVVSQTPYKSKHEASDEFKILAVQKGLVS